MGRFTRIRDHNVTSFKVNKIYDEVKELRSSLEAFRTEMKQYTVTVMEGANRQQSMTEKRGKVDAIMQMSNVDSQQGLGIINRFFIEPVEVILYDMFVVILSCLSHRTHHVCLWS